MRESKLSLEAQGVGMLNASAKRASLDLTRALALLRKSQWQK
jgi:hypothetical protein